jgi:hypothetical protein
MYRVSAVGLRTHRARKSFIVTRRVRRPAAPKPNLKTLWGGVDLAGNKTSGRKIAINPASDGPPRLAVIKVKVLAAFVDRDLAQTFDCYIADVAAGCNSSVSTKGFHDRASGKTVARKFTQKFPQEPLGMLSRIVSVVKR